MKYRAAALLCVCCLAMGMTGCIHSADKSGGTVSKTEKNTDMDEGEKEPPKQGKGQQVVTGGYQLTLPEGITPQVNEEGLILSDENMNYQMLVTVRDYAFDRKKEEPEFFAEKVKEAGYKITREVEILPVAGREFAYFTYLNEEDQMLLAYSKAEENETFATLLQRYGTLSDEELLTQTANILATAEKTELPDTAPEDIPEKNPESDSDLSGYTEEVESVELAVEETEVTVSVPDDFYLIKEDEPSEWARLFTSADGMVNVSLYAVSDMGYEKPKDWLEDTILIPEEAQKVSKSDILQEKAGDQTVYYQVVSYEEESSYKDATNTYLELCAVCPVAEGVWLQLQADARGTAGLNFDMVKEFFKVK